MTDMVRKKELNVCQQIQLKMLKKLISAKTGTWY